MATGTRLYVGNLTEDATTDALRARFAPLGLVSDVQLVTDRSSGRMRGYAFVTMENSGEARQAITKLNGAMFEGRPLRVNEAGEPREEGTRGHRADKTKGVRITSQFREAHNMTYELDCATVPLAIRMFPADPIDGIEQWRVEAFSKGSAESLVSATASSRALALAQVEREWNEKNAASSLPMFDWVAIVEAMTTVRAI